jgi:hypothetical protein
MWYEIKKCVVVPFSILWYLFINLIYIFLKFHHVSSEKSEIPTVLTVLLIAVDFWKVSMTKSWGVQYKEVYIWASAFDR